MGKPIKCRIPGCSAHFRDKLQATMHTANTWHCGMCGMSDGRELTYENLNQVCSLCVTATSNIEYYRVDFKRKCYVAIKAGKVQDFVKKEQGKWVHHGC
jgi:hypothetical protein